MWLAHGKGGSSMFNCMIYITEIPTIQSVTDIYITHDETVLQDL